MKDKEILYKSLVKAVNAGMSEDVYNHYSNFVKHYNINGHSLIVPFIYSKDFAKAFWGEEKTPINWKAGNNKSWQVHLQQMVLEENPIQYLERFL